MKHVLCKCLLLLVSFPVIGSAEEVPQWMRQVITSNIPDYAKNASAVVLFAESRVTVEPSGRFITTNRRVLKVLSRDGRRRAVARAVYRTNDGKVRDLHGWLLPPSSMFKSYDKPVDFAAINDDVYNETRLKVISATDDAEPGSIFGYEAVTEELSPFTQLEWDFQDDLPAVVSRLIVDLPEDWTAQIFTFNHTPIEALTSRGTRTWELRDLTGIDIEPYMPGLTELIPRLALTFVPPPGRSKGTSPTFQTWQEVSAWLALLNDPQAQPTSALIAKAQELTAGAGSELQKIRVIARYVQGFQYVSVQTGIGRGGGYRPHSAGDIFSKAYGDCKDKVTVMRAMLMAVGITSYPVAIYSGDASYVSEVWPSPQQFNHAIIAIKISDSASSAAALDHPAIGRLMIFDPTDPDTPLGDIPEDEQGSLGLLVAGENGALLRMPVVSSELNQTNRYVEVALQADGSITATVQEDSLGLPGTSARREFRGQSPSDFTRLIEGRFSQTVTGAVATDIEPDDNWIEGRFRLKGEFKAAGYARLMNNRLLVFKPAVLNRRDSFVLGDSRRKHPVVMRAEAHSDVVRVKLPAAFKIDEIPDAINLETAFGRYVISYKVSEGELLFERKLVLQSTVIPPEQYSAVRDFFQQIMMAEQAAVVLIKN